MSIGLVGKPNGVRLITGSVYYGEKTKEQRNRKYKLNSSYYGRKIIIAGNKVKKGTK